MFRTTEEITIRQTAEETTSTVPSGQAPTTGHTTGARSGAGRKDTRPMISWTGSQRMTVGARPDDVLILLAGHAAIPVVTENPTCLPG